MRTQWRLRRLGKGCEVPAQAAEPDQGFFSRPADLTQPVDAVRKAIGGAGVGSGRIGLEKSSNYLQLGIAEGIMARSPGGQVGRRFRRSRGMPRGAVSPRARVHTRSREDLRRHDALGDCHGGAGGPNGRHRLGSVRDDDPAWRYGPGIHTHGTVEEDAGTRTRPHGTRADSSLATSSSSRCRAVFTGTTHPSDAWSTSAALPGERSAYTWPAGTQSKR